MTTEACFVGVGVGRYDEGHDQLDHAVTDVKAFAGLLDGVFVCTLLSNPTEQVVRDGLKALRDSLPDGGSLVLLWSGHAIPSPADGLRLLARDSGRFPTDGLGAASDVAARCAESGATQLLVIVDTCFSGEAMPAGDVASRLLALTAPAGEHVWVGVLTSCLSAETARDGLFGQRLLKLLKTGPDMPELRVRWSPHSVFIRGDDLCDAVLKDWDSGVQSPDFLSRGSAWWMFPNPLYDPGAPERVVEHLLLAARGGAEDDEYSWFTGRTVEVDQVVGWVRSRQPGLHVVTGSAGTGKTAIVGRVVSLSNREERERLLDEGHALGHADPGQGSVHAHAHARGLTADRAADIIGEQLVRTGVLVAQEAHRNAAELVGQVQHAVDDGAELPVIVIDGLDEARGQAFAIAEDLAVRLAAYAVVIVSTRELRSGETDPSLLDLLAAGAAELDLDDPAVQERGRGDVRAYVSGRLAGVSADMDGETVGRYLAEEAPVAGSGPFLLARLVTDQLRATPVNTSQPGWQEEVSHSIEDAFDKDLARVGPQSPDMADTRSLTGAARVLLAALAWALGPGLPEAEWLACANAIATGGMVFDREDVTWVLNELGRYVVQDGEAGVAVYRIAHQSLADYIRPPFAASYDHPFEPQALPVAAALLARYTELLAGGVPATSPGYLWRYAWRHAASAGPAGLDLLRDLAADEPQLVPDVGVAAGEVAGRLAHWGYLAEAVSPAEEAGRLYRELAAANPAFLPNLASALNNLGIRYGGVGRREDALAATEEAGRLYRELAAANPAFLPDLASALNNLGIRYSEMGRREDALAATEEAVTLRRELAAANPAFLPNLASALNNLGIRYGGVGRREDALAAAEEAVTLRRELAAANPAFLPNLASALNNLGNHYSGVGRREDALAATEEAVTLRRELAAANPAFLPNLAMALNNLGIRYGEMGRREDALAATEEAVTLRRELAAANPAFLPNLASALNNLGIRYSGVGRREDALAPAEEAGRLYRELAAANPAFLPDLASALNNLGIRYREMGRREDALAPAEEAGRLYRELAAANPAFLPDLASALNNLGNHYGEMGRREDALAATEEAITLRRELAAANPAFLPNLAMALNNLGIRYSDMGRREDALAATEEAGRLYRELAAANPAFLPDLASALNNLGIRYSDMGRREDALAATEEAGRLYRELAAANPAFLPDLASALNNLGNHYSDMGRREDALAAAEEAGRLYRELAAANPAFLPDLAMALNNLGIRYSDMGRREDALAATEEAGRLYRELAAANPAFLPDLAMALNNLGIRYSEAGTPEREDPGWEEATSSVDPPSAAFLLVMRARSADAGHPDAASWLARALSTGGGDRGLLAAAHDEGRRHRTADRPTFDREWGDHSGGPVPAWLTVDPGLLSTAREWVRTETYAAERDHLDAHPELLEPSADVAVEEALLAVSEAAAGRYTALRQAARQEGTETAYRPLLLAILAQEFATSDPGQQRAMLATRRDDLLSDAVAAHLHDLAAQDDDLSVAALQARALLDLARQDDAEMVFEAVARPEEFPGLLHALAVRPDPSSLIPAAIVASSLAVGQAQAAAALFYCATGTAFSGDHDRAADMIAQALTLDAAQAGAWINELASIGQQHHEVLALIPVLTRPSGASSPEEPADDGD